MLKNVVLFGATGSVGTSVLEVLSKSPENFKLSAVTCNNNIVECICFEKTRNLIYQKHVFLRYKTVKS